MKVTTFDIEFNYKDRKFKASCQKFQVHNYPQIRVAVDRGRKDPDIYVFYDVKGEKHRYFWFKLPDIREQIARVIAKSMAKVDK